MKNLLEKVFSPDTSGDNHKGAGERTRADIRRFFIIFILGSLIWITALAASGKFFRVIGTLGMLSASGLVSGGFLGFLFGIPRSLSSTAAPAMAIQNQDSISVQPNTNLEQISDWLTKVLVGVGLADIGQIKSTIGQVVTSMDPILGSKSVGGGIAGISVLSAYFFAGFLWAYFESRTSLMAIFGQDLQRVRLQRLSTLPQITNATPLGGNAAGGDKIVISGTGLSGVSGVIFGSQAAQFTIDGDLQITATSPAGVANSVVYITVIPGAVTTTPIRFTYS